MPPTTDAPAKRFNLYLPDEVYEELKQVAEKNKTTPLDLIKSFIRAGLLIADYQSKPDAGIYFREPGGELEKVKLIFS